MLLDMKAITEGVRAMIFKGFYCLDLAEHSADRKKAGSYAETAAILTPLIKGYGSEATLGVIATAMQVLGGVGYTNEYPIEQYLRDSKILTIWEGTTFIHGNDLVGRKMRMNGGASFSDWISGIKDFVDSHAGDSPFVEELRMLRQGYECLEGTKACYDRWYDEMDEKRQFIPLNAVRALMVCAQVQAAECLLEQAFIATERLEKLPEGHFDHSFYEGKIASARHYARQVLPAVFTIYASIKSDDRTCLDCSEEALVVG